MSTKKSANANVALVKTLSALNAGLDKADAELAGGPTLTPDEKRRSARARKGSDRVIQVLAQLAKTHGLDSPSLNSTEMLDRLETATRLAPTIARLTKVLKQMSDAQFVAQNDAWAMGRQLYSLLQTRSATDGALAGALQPVTDFFAYRHESALESKPTKLQTRMNAKLRAAERLVARSKPRASVLEAESDAHAAAVAAPVAAPVAVAPVAAAAPAAPSQPQQPSIVIVQPPVPAATPAPIAQPVVPVAPPSQPSQPSQPVVTNGVNGVNGTNGAASAALLSLNGISR